MYLHLQQPDVFLGSLRIAEPVIAFTGLLMGGVALFAWSELRKTQEPSPPQKWMRLFFGVLAVSAIVGALLGHAFNYVQPKPFKYPSWLLALAAMTLLQRAAFWRLEPLVGPQTLRKLLFVNVVQGALFAGLLFWDLWFGWVHVHTALCLLFTVGAVETLHWRRTKPRESRLMLSSIVPALAATGVSAVQWSPSVWFVHQDVAHIFVCASLLLMYLGARAM